MAKFKVGEIAIGQNFIISTYLNGVEMEIIGELRAYGIGFQEGEPCEPYKLKGYLVLEPNGSHTVIEEKLLRKKKPPEEEINWVEKLELKNWNPKKVVCDG